MYQWSNPTSSLSLLHFFPPLIRPILEVSSNEKRQIFDKVEKTLGPVSSSSFVNDFKGSILDFTATSQVPLVMFDQGHVTLTVERSTTRIALTN